MSDPRDAIDVRWEPLQGPPRKLSLRPRADGRWTRVELEWSGCRWREVGCEVVDDVDLEVATARPIGEE